MDELRKLLLKGSELLEDLLDGRRAITDYLEDRGLAIDAEDVFERLGH